MTKTIDSIENLLKIVDLFPALKEVPPGVVKNYYELIARYAPTVASEPFLVGPVIKGVAMMGTFDPSIMIKLIELEQAMMDSIFHRIDLTSKVRDHLRMASSMAHKGIGASHPDTSHRDRYQVIFDEIGKALDDVDN